jgi:hypothetical protein
MSDWPRESDGWRERRFADLEARIKELEAEVTRWKLEARDSEDAFNRSDRYAGTLQARLRAADELADAVEQNFTKSEPQPGVYQYHFTGQWESNPYEIATAYREAGR